MDIEKLTLEELEDIDVGKLPSHLAGDVNARIDQLKKEGEGTVSQREAYNPGERPIRKSAFVHVDDVPAS